MILHRNPFRLLAEQWKPVCMAFLLFSITLILFWPATKYEFLNFDDDRYVSGNLVVLNGLTVDGIKWAFRYIYESYWLPVMWLSYMLDASIWGRGAFGFHFTNILLHAANSSLLFLLIRTWTRRLWPSFFVAALFAFHPLRIESVVWIAERKDVLSGFFFLLSLYFYKRYADRPEPGREVPSAACMALGLLTKPILVTLPFLLLVLDFWPLKRWSLDKAGLRKLWTELISEKILFWSLAIIFSGLTYYTQSAGKAVHGLDTVPWFQRMLEIPTAYGFYIQKTLFPFDLRMIYGDLNKSLLIASLSLLVLVLITLLSWFARKQNPALLTGWLWFLGLLIPVIGIVRVGVVHVADRFTYLPSIGIIIFVVWGALFLIERYRVNAYVFGILGFSLIAGSIWQTRATMPHWKSSISAFGHVLKSMPDNALANNNYGQALLEAGHTQEALAHFGKAISLEPYTTPYIANAGMALILLGRTDESIELTGRALEAVDSSCPFLNFSQGLAWTEKGKPESAIPYFKKAIGNATDRPSWRLELARAYFDANHIDEATAEFNRVEAEGGTGLSNVNGMMSYYMSLWKNGHGRRAWTFFDHALTLQTNNVLILNNAAWMLSTYPVPGVSPEKAVQLALRARELSGNDHPNILDTLATAYAANGNFDQAVYWAEIAQSKSHELGNTALALQIESRLQAYREGRVPEK